jgi:2-keto-4-pentenoate hydratase/2-oxohepta-3-ene-1,7-dioic acid hydratase in catechol pathway
MQLPPAILAIGRNYAEHAAEMKGDVSEHPVVFMKNPASVICNGRPIVIPSICNQPHEQVDFEGELAVVIGRDTRDVAADRALECVGGYCIANDVSARQRYFFGLFCRWPNLRQRIQSILTVLLFCS